MEVKKSSLRKLVLTKPINGKQHAILAERPTSIPNRSICLLSVLGGGGDYSLWLVEVDEAGENMYLWPYEGTDTQELIIEMLEEFLETAFDE
ncbi:MAG: hypothetical protein FWD36_05940 [Treponema sp.]|nr:hypothetical protein [Treponema sp.]